MNEKTREDIEKSSLSEEEKEIELEIFDQSQKKRVIVTTSIPLPPGEKAKIITTHELPSDLSKVKTERFWDKEKTMKKPTLVTSDVALSESEEGDLKRAEVIAEIEKEKEKDE